MSLRPSPFLGATEGRRASAQTAKAAPNRRPERTRPDLRLVESTPKLRLQTRTPRWRLVFYVAATGALLFAVVAFHVLLSQGQFALDDMKAQTAEEQATYERLRLDVAQLESPERITTEAIERLGMVPAEQVQAVSPRAEDVAPGTGPAIGQSGATVDDKATASDGTSDPANARTWAELKPHLSAQSR